MDIIHILIYGILFVLVDALYLSNISGPYGKMIENIQGSKMVFRLYPAAIVYFSLVGAWYVFIYRESALGKMLQDLPFLDFLFTLYMILLIWL